MTGRPPIRSGTESCKHALSFLCQTDDPQHRLCAHMRWQERRTFRRGQLLRWRRTQRLARCPPPTTQRWPLQSHTLAEARAYHRLGRRSVGICALCSSARRHCLRFPCLESTANDGLRVECSRPAAPTCAAALLPTSRLPVVFVYSAALSGAPTWW